MRMGSVSEVLAPTRRELWWQEREKAGSAHTAQNAPTRPRRKGKS